MSAIGIRSVILSVVLLALPIAAAPAVAHCDTMDGPVVKAAQKALATRDLDYLAIWVPAKDEAELRAAFDRALAVRTLGDTARELADRYLFETAVRLHRGGEGEPYTGVKPAGTPVERPVLLADRAIDAGSIEALLKAFNDDAAARLREDFARVRELSARETRDVRRGREYVDAYVTFVHRVERLFEPLMREREAAAHAGGR